MKVSANASGGMGLAGEKTGGAKHGSIPYWLGLALPSQAEVM